MLHERAGGDLADPLSLQPVALDQGSQRRREHLLVANLRVSAVAARKWNSHAADDRDAPWIGPNQHMNDSAADEGSELWTSRGAYNPLDDPIPFAASLATLVLATARLQRQRRARCSGAGDATGRAAAASPGWHARPWRSPGVATPGSTADSGLLDRIPSSDIGMLISSSIRRSATASGDHRHDDRLENSLSPQYLADSLALERRALAELLDAARAARDTARARLTYELFKRERELAIEGYTCIPRSCFRSIRSRVMAQDFAVMGFGRRTAAVRDAKDYENWLRRIDAFALWARQAIDNLRSGMRRGYLAPRALVEDMLPQLAAARRGQRRESVLSAADRPAGRRSTVPQRASLAERFDAAVKTKVLPAYRSLHDFLAKRVFAARA
jgi:hypothetical protein